MSATNQTEFLKLGQYIAQDKPSFLGTYNSDMQTIDNFAENTSARLEQLENKNTQDDVTTEKIQADIEELQTDVETVKDTVKNVPQDEQNITNLQQDMATVKQNIQTIQQGDAQNAETVNNLVSNVTTLNASVTNLDNRVTTIENGGGNTGNTNEIYHVVLNSGNSWTKNVPTMDASSNKIARCTFEVETYEGSLREIGVFYFRPSSILTTGVGFFQISTTNPYNLAWLDVVNDDYVTNENGNNLAFSIIRNFKWLSVWKDEQGKIAFKLYTENNTNPNIQTGILRLQETNHDQNTGYVTRELMSINIHITLH